MTKIILRTLETEDGDYNWTAALGHSYLFSSNSKNVSKISGAIFEGGDWKLEVSKAKSREKV